MSNRTDGPKQTAVRSLGMANPQIKVSVAEGLHSRLEEEAARLGVPLNDLVRFALFAAIEAPRRLDDMKSLDVRLTDIEQRLKKLERR